MIPSGFVLGWTIGIGLWATSQNSKALATFSYGILELYSAFVALFAGLLLAKEILATVIAHARFIRLERGPDWKQVGENLLWLFIFCEFGLFVSAWMEAIVAYSLYYADYLLIPAAAASTAISLIVICVLSSGLLEHRRQAKAKATLIFGQTEEDAPKLPPGVWTVCPSCGAYISAQIEYCVCGTKLPEPPRKRR